MKHIAFYLLFGFIFLASKNSFAQKPGLIAYKSHFENNFNGWIKTFPGFTLSSFKEESVAGFENFDYMDISDTTEFYSVYKPALAFSPDKNQFIDIYSYWLNLEKEGKTIVYRGGEPDQAVTLCNFKTKKWVRILFRGTTERIQDVVWITNSQFILVGARQDDFSKGHPVIYFGNTVDRAFKSFVSTDNKLVQNKNSYDAPKLLKLKIKKK